MEAVVGFDSSGLVVGIIGTVDRPVDEKQLDKDARRTLKKNGIKDPSGMDVDMEPLGMTGGRSPTGPKTAACFMGTSCSMQNIIAVVLQHIPDFRKEHGIMMYHVHQLSELLDLKVRG